MLNHRDFPVDKSIAVRCPIDDHFAALAGMATGLALAASIFLDSFWAREALLVAKEVDLC